MPHTSHKKKTPRKKRQETVDDDGWTRITSQTSSNAHNIGQLSSLSSQDVDSPEFRDTISSMAKVKSSPQEAEENMTNEKLLERYSRIESNWKKSESCLALVTHVTRALDDNIPVTRCVCFGTGTMSGLREGWIERHDVALYQLAAFKSIVDTIETVQGTSPACFAQEPDYNKLDAYLLSTLSITKVDHPIAFGLLTADSVAFCPGAELSVIVRALVSDPFILLSHDLEFYSSQNGKPFQMLLRSLAAVSEQEVVETEELTGVDLNEDEPRRFCQCLQDSKYQGWRIIEPYLRRREGMKLPELDAKDSPFHDMSVYWKSINRRD